MPTKDVASIQQLTDWFGRLRQHQPHAVGLAYYNEVSLPPSYRAAVYRAVARSSGGAARSWDVRSDAADDVAG